MRFLAIDVERPSDKVAENVICIPIYVLPVMLPPVNTRNRSRSCFMIGLQSVKISNVLCQWCVINRLYIEIRGNETGIRLTAPAMHARSTVIREQLGISNQLDRIEIVLRNGRLTTGRLSCWDLMNSRY